MSTGNKQLLQRYAQPLYVSSTTDDVNVPFSFQDWYSAHQGIVPGQEFKQYNDYLVRWYRDKSETITDSKLQLKLNYLTLLKQLQMFFTAQEAENWYSKVNLDNEKELLLAIPYFAKKLKDISLYYLQLRTAIKESRLRYNQTGTNVGIIEQLQKFLLTNYTKKPNSSISLPGSIWKDVPELSAVKDNITIQIEELYDTQNYFDQTPTLPPSAYYTVDSAELEKFLTSKGLTLSSTDWIYRLGVNSLSANYIGIADQDLTEISNKIAEKYLGEDMYTSTIPNVSTEKQFYSLDVIQGNNFFYWPEGIYRSRALQQPRLQAVSINEAGLNTVATAGSSIDIADTIFVKTPRGIEGAWFRNRLYDYKTENMESVIESDRKTTFRYPFPGFGLSADDILWTGFDLKFTPSFFFLEEDIQKLVENEYWSTQISISTTIPLLINDTTLVDSNAYSDINFNRADKIEVWQTPPNYNTPIFNGEAKSAWLYRFNKTDISVGQGLNTIVWPFEKINSEEDYPQYYPTNISDTCLSIPVCSLDIPYSVAGDSLSSSDVIYKITNYQDGIENATEACWLSGKTTNLSNINAILTQQNSFQLLLSSGEYVKFVWTGKDNIDANDVFKTILHQSDCKYITTPNTNYQDFGLCTCKQVNFAPFGHPGENFTDNRSLADFIIEDNFTPGNLDLTVWKDSSNNDYLNSSSFAWYKTDNKTGWGYGNWHSGDPTIDNKFYLQYGKKYVYYRTKASTQNIENFILPSYVVRYTDSEFNTPGKWLRAYKNENNEWVQTTSQSNFVLTPGDTLIYNRKNTINFNLTGTTLEEIDISENRGSIWTNFDYITISPDKQIVLNYPSQTFLQTSNTDQYPVIGINNLLSIFQWSISGTNLPLRTYRNTSSVLFTPLSTGLYTFSVTAVSATQLGLSAYSAATSGYYIFTRIPLLTVDPQTVEVPTLTGYSVPVPGFVWNISLQGWDYNLSIKNPYATNKGAKPFWAKTYIEKDSTTGSKGIQSWGTPQRFVDDYNILTQPEISDIVLTIGNKIEYTRNNPVDLNWVQPVNFQIFINEKNWCTLEFETTSDSNFSYQLNNFKNELVVTPTISTSNIKLNSLVDNEPTEIYYNALNSFVWLVTATPEIEKTIYSNVSASLAIKTNQPWANISNQFYPTFAAFPSIDKLYSSIDTGGFFNPSNLGISTYVNKDFVGTLDVSSTALTAFFQNINQGAKGRGFTKQDQISPYTDIIDNNIWMKEPTVAGPIAGTIKKSVFKKYQKFLPYQSGYETNSRLQIGMLTPKSRQSPWGGKEDSEWTDVANFPQSPTGEINVQAWAESQILKQSGLQVDNWCTDVFGNQYALYKQLSAATPINKKFIPGEIWVRKNSQFTSPASISLKNVFDTYTNTNLINELTGQGVRKIDVFFDTLLVETSGVIIFEKLLYDFNNNNIFSLTDEARYISLAMPVSANLDKEFANINLSGFNFAQAGETWFFPEEKLITQSICGLEGSILTPELYQFNLNTLILKKIFPASIDDIITIKQLSSLNFASINSPILSHNSFRKEYLLTLFGKNTLNKDIMIEFIIKDLPILVLDKVIVYESLSDTVQLTPPFITQQLYTELLITNIDFENKLNFQCVAENGPVVFEPVSMPSWVNLTSSGLFTGTPPLETTSYTATFKITNSVGPTFYSLVIDVNYVEVLSFYYLYTEGYESSAGEGLGIFDDNGYVVQEDYDPTAEEDVSLIIVGSFFDFPALQEE